MTTQTRKQSDLQLFTRYWPKKTIDSLLNEIYPNLFESPDTALLLMLLDTIVCNYDNIRDHKEEVTIIINKFTNLNFFSWSFVYYMAKDYWKEMSDGNVTAIFENLKNHDNITYGDDGMLNSIGEKTPKAMISFFHYRIEFAKAKKISDPIPMNF